MGVSFEFVRATALALPGVEEGVCFGTAAFYVRRKLMLRLREDAETLVVAYPKAHRENMLESLPDVLSVTDHYRNYDYLLLNLPNADTALVRRMIEGAWRMKAAKKVVKAYDANQ